MRTIALFVVGALISVEGVVASAQPRGAATGEFDARLRLKSIALEHREVDQLEESARGRISSGKVVALLGVAGMVGGVVLIKLGDAEANNPDNPEDPYAGLGQSVGGTLLVVAGAAVSVGGLALLASGQTKLKSAKKRRASIAVGPNADGGFAAMVSGTF